MKNALIVLGVLAFAVGGAWGHIETQTMLHRIEEQVAERYAASTMIDGDLVESTPIGTHVNGIATWFDAERKGQSTWYTRAGITNYAAAGPALRNVKHFAWGVEPYQVEITVLKTGRTALVWVVDWCQCSKGEDDERLIDLAPAVWDLLGVDLSRGVMDVNVEVLP